MGGLSPCAKMCQLEIRPRVSYNGFMDETAKTLLELIKVSQFGGEFTVPEGCDLDALYKEASLQSVLGLVSPYVPSPRGKWEEASYRHTANYVRYCYAEEQLINVMDDIPFVILKGNAAAVYYKTPSERSMGDIDFQVLPSDFDRVKDLLIESGYQLTQESEDYTRHIGLSRDGFSFELHRRFSHDIDLEDLVVPGIEDRVTGDVDSHSFPMLPPLANGIVLLDHMRSHLQSGLGLRQVIDWMLYVNAELDDSFWNDSFGTVAKDKGLATLAVVTTRMCQKYLGLPADITWCSSASDALCDELMENLLSSGNFGRKHGTGSKVETVTTAFKTEGVFRRLQRAGKHNWKLYKKHHWLLPFCWIYQAFRYLKQGLFSGRGASGLRSDAARGKDRYELLKKLEIF